MLPIDFNVYKENYLSINFQNKVSAIIVLLMEPIAIKTFISVLVENFDSTK